MNFDCNGLKIIIGKNIPETDAPQRHEEIVEDPRAIVHEVCRTITEGGYNFSEIADRLAFNNPVSQLVGFIESDDPTHISNYNNARTMIGRIDRDELIEDMVKTYIKTLEDTYGSITDDGDTDTEDDYGDN